MLIRICAIVCAGIILCSGPSAQAESKASRGNKPRVSDTAGSSRTKYLDGRASQVESTKDQAVESAVSKNKLAKQSAAQKKTPQSNEQQLTTLVGRMEEILKKAEQNSDSRTFRVLGTSSASNCGATVLAAPTACSSASSLNAWLVVRRSTSIVPVTTYATVAAPGVAGFSYNNVSPVSGFSFASGATGTSCTGAASFGATPGTRLITSSPYQTIHYRGASPAFVSPSRSYPYMTFTGATQYTDSRLVDTSMPSVGSSPGISSPGMIVIQSYIQ